MPGIHGKQKRVLGSPGTVVTEGRDLQHGAGTQTFGMGSFEVQPVLLTTVSSL